MRKLLQLKTRFQQPENVQQLFHGLQSDGHAIHGTFPPKSKIASILDSHSTTLPLKRHSHKVSHNPNKQSNTNLFRRTVPSRSQWLDCLFCGRHCPNSWSTIRRSKYIHRSILRTPVSSLSSQPCQNTLLMLSYGNDQIPFSLVHCSWNPTWRSIGLQPYLAECYLSNPDRATHQRCLILHKERSPWLKDGRV